MNLGKGGCSEPRSCYCTPAWATEGDPVSKKRKNVAEMMLCNFQDLITKSLVGPLGEVAQVCNPAFRDAEVEDRLSPEIQNSLGNIAGPGLYKKNFVLRWSC